MAYRRRWRRRWGRKRRRYGRKRFFRRRRRFSRRRAFKRIARKVRHLAKAVELKRIEFFIENRIEVSNSITNTNQTQFLFPIPVGDLTNERIGNKIFVKYVDLRFRLESQGSAAQKDYFNIYLVRQKTIDIAGGANPVTTDLWSASTGVMATNEFRTYVYRNNYRIIKTIKQWVDPTTVWQSQKNYHFRWKINKTLEWSLGDTTGGITQLRKNAYWWIIRGDFIPGSVNCPDVVGLTWVVRYTDM